MSNTATEDPKLKTLTARELEILRAIGRGNTANQIGAQLKISPKTVDAHRESIKKKLGVHSIVELVKYAIRTKLVEP